MIFTYTIYLGTLLLSVLFTSNVKVRYSPLKNGLIILIGLLPIIVISGLRMDVGTDDYFYRFYYEEYFIPSSSLSSSIYTHFTIYEPLFTIITQLCKTTGLNYTHVKILYALITWLPIALSIKEEKKYPYIIIFIAITSGFMFMTFNGVRQMMAWSYILLSVRYIDDSKFGIFPFLFFIAVATMLHYTSLIALPVFLFLSKYRVTQRQWLFIYTLSLFTPFRLFDTLMAIFSTHVPGYTSYYVNRALFEINSFSLGVVYQISIGYLAIYFYKYIPKNNNRIYYYFSATIIGHIIYALFWNSYVLLRVAVIFINFQMFSISLIILYLYRNRRKEDATAIIILFLLTYIYRIYTNDSGVSPYEFVSF